MISIAKLIDGPNSRGQVEYQLVIEGDFFVRHDAENVRAYLAKCLIKYEETSKLEKDIKRLEAETEKHAKAYREAQEQLEKARKEYKELVK